MTDKDFAKMSTEELILYCDKLEKELNTAKWYLENREKSEAHLK